MIQVTAAIIENREGELLICQRGAGGSCAFLWEFPGGKCEEGESLEECVVRECKEELDLDIAVTAVFGETTYRYPEKEINLTFFNAEIISGTMRMDVHNDMKWVRPDELVLYTFCPADEQVVGLLGGPHKLS